MRARGVAALSGYARGVVAITAVALFGRVILLDTLPRLWGDEAFTGVAVRHSLWEMLDVVRHDNHPPLAYLLVRLVAVVSTTPGALRAVSALAGAAAVPLAAALGRRLGGDRSGLFAAAAVAAFPQFLLYSRDVRMYALATTMVLACALTLWRALETPSRGRLLGYAICVAAAVYSHYFAVLAVSAQLLVALLALRPPPRTAARLVAACAVGGLTLVAWLLLALPQFQHAGAAFWIAPVTLGTLLQPPAQPLTAVAQWLAAAAAVALVVHLYRRPPPDRRRWATFLLASAAAPTAALFLVSFIKPLYDPRFAGMFWGPGVAAVGAALGTWRRPAPAVAAVGVLAAAAVATLLAIHNPDFDAVMAPVAGRLGPGDIVAVNGPAHYFSVAYAVGATEAPRLHVVARDIPWYFGVAGYPPGAQVDTVPRPAGRLYMVSDADQAAPDLPPGMRRVDRACQDGICLETYIP